MTSTSAESGNGPRKRRAVRKILIGIGLLLALILVAGAVMVGPYLFERNAYEGVPSIEARADYRDPALMQAAWSMPVARAYRAGGFEYQDNPSFCGPTSIANLLRSLGRPTDQHQVIDGTNYEPWFGVLLGGLTLDELADLLAQRLDRPVATVRNPTLDAFRRHLARANDPDVRLIVNFHRGPLFGRGLGHFSPVLAYLPDRDLVLVGDTNRDYRPFLVGSELLWRAMNTVDSDSGRPRGLLVVTGSSR